MLSNSILLELTMPILRVYYFSATLQPPRTKNTLSTRAPALQMPAWAPAWQQGFSTRGGTSLCRSVPSICPYFTKHQKHVTTHFLSKLHSLILKCFQTPIVEYAAYLMSPCEGELELALFAFHLVILKYFQRSHRHYTSSAYHSDVVTFGITRCSGDFRSLNTQHETLSAHESNSLSDNLESGNPYHR